MVGQYLGAGELEKAKDADNKMIVFSVFCCVVVAGIMLILGGLFPQIYNTTDEIKALATDFIAVSALIMPFCAFCHCSYFTLRSGGKTFCYFLIRFCFYMGSGSSGCVCSGTFYRTWNRERLLLSTGNRDDQGCDRLLHGAQ